MIVGRGRMGLFTLALLGFSLIASSVQQDGKEPFTFDDFMNGRFSASGYGGVWVSDEDIQLRNSAGDIVLWNVVSNANSTVVPAKVLSDSRAQSYVFSADRQLLLISYDIQAQFRHSTTARFTVYSLNDETFSPIADSALLQTAAWSPNGRGLLYVQDNDLYYTSDVSSAAPSRITTSGVPGIIYNAVPDWVYEEEVLAASTAYWFSPDGTGLVYLEFNDTLVPEITYLHYGTPGTLEDQYPSEVTVRYPKTGRRNPSHTAYYVDLTSPELTPTLIRSDTEGLVISYGFAWNSNEQFVELLMNRVQNESSLLLCDVGGTCSSILNRITIGGWDRSGLPYFDSTGERFLGIESVPVGDLGTFSHLVLRKTERGELAAILTTGPFIVLGIVGWDEDNDAIYYTANIEGRPSNNHVYRVSSSGSDSVCVTCGLVTPEGNPCTSASARFSSGYSSVILTCSGPDPTTIALYTNELPIGAPKTVLQSNSGLRDYIQTKLVPTRYDRKVTVPGGFEAEVRLLLPPNFDENSKYPLLINVYGGPDSNQIGEGFFGGWDSYLTTNLSVIYGFIDGRGSGRKGDSMMFAGYRNLGTVEIEDQINVTRALQDLPWVDEERTAIWGWSYGGYATGRTLELDTEGVFKCGISVAPVTSWLYYDSIYTERYMGLPTEEDNLSGYQSGDLVSNVDNLKTKRYYLIHGNADDNVHYQQSMLLSRALELDDVLFQQQSYPDENHSLGGVSRHLYHSMDTFWKSCFEIE